MRILIRWFSVVSLILMILSWNGSAIALGNISMTPTDQASCIEFGQKIDLNNANIVAFMDCQGFYPNLAKLIITHGPYQTVEDVLQIPGLTDSQKELLTSYLDRFAVANAVVPLAQRMPPRPAPRK